jgi:DNA-directed RNA polymerase specialized sigma24 family protein
MANDDDPTDEVLMTAFVHGDARAFEQLYERHHAALYRFVRRVLGSAGAVNTDEVFQDTWLRVVHARSRWEPQGAAWRTWLFKDAGNAAPFEPFGTPWVEWPAPPSSVPDSAELIFWRRAGEQLLHCLDELPPPQRSAFLLHHDDGLSLDEVARALAVGFETAKTRLRYAMSKLRTCMGAYLAPQTR